MKNNKFFALFLLCLAILLAQSSYAASSDADRIVIEAGVRTNVKKDLAMPYNPQEKLVERKSIDGRECTDFDGDIVELWLNLECTYCGIQSPLSAQRSMPNVRIVVRHIPTNIYPESLKKALSYEALRVFSVNAANIFWDTIIPKTSLAIPVAYESALMLALQSANIEASKFSDVLITKAATVVNNDMLAGYGHITSTPTYIVAGIRFPSCNFTAKELPHIVTLAKKARAGDADATEEIIALIVQGYLEGIHL